VTLNEISNQKGNSRRFAYFGTGLAVLLLLGILFFIPLSTFSYCRADEAINDKEQALAFVIDSVVERNLVGFEELGGPQGFVDLLRKEPDCCRAGGGEFDWSYMTHVWSVDLQSRSRKPGYLLSVAVDRCKNILWHGTMRAPEGTRQDSSR
jgi:hypothetical protein